MKTCVGLLAALAAIVAGCATTRIPGPPAGSRYVAMGSSYAAGPGIGQRDPIAPPSCNQSQDNYSHQLARRRQLTLVDRSCGGATTLDILGKGQFELPAQLDALTADTRLVTVTIGGNDVGFVGVLFGSSCERAADRIGATGYIKCPSTVAWPDEAAWQRLEANLQRIIDAVHQRAPSARLVFVDYLSVLPVDDRTCDELPFGADTQRRLRALATRLAGLTQAVARKNRAGVVEASTLSRTHAVCASDAWMVGFPLPTAPPGVVGFHPNAAGMTAVANALEQQLYGTRAR